MDTKANVKHSIIFLEYDPEGINRETTIKSLQSVIEHSKDYDFELIHIKNVKGFVCAVNKGLQQATGEYIAVVANDVFIKDYEWLPKLAQYGLCGWRLTPFFLTGELRPDFACWGMPYSVFEQIGLMDERFAEGYGFDDDDYVYRARELDIPIIDSKIDLEHLECLTYKTVFKKDKEAMTSRNQSIFYDKWQKYL